MTVTQPTPYPDVNAFLHQFLSRVRDILGADFVGLYLYGSLSLGDFDPASSDIDAVVATAAPLRSGVVEELRELHARLLPRPRHSGGFATTSQKNAPAGGSTSEMTRPAPMYVVVSR